MNKNFRNILIFSIVIICFMIYVSFYTYSLFESVVSNSVDSDIAKWNIKVNNSMITSGNTIDNTFNIGGINWLSGGHVKEGKAAPGSIGSFTIEVDPTDTQVSFTYQIEIDTSSLNNDYFIIQSVSERNNSEFYRIGENTYVGVAKLSDINLGKKYYIDVNIEWVNNDLNNANDYEIGKNATEGVYIPVNIELNQYFGTEVFNIYEDNGE